MQGRRRGRRAEAVRHARPRRRRHHHGARADQNPAHERGGPSVGDAVWIFENVARGTEQEGNEEGCPQGKDRSAKIGKSTKRAESGGFGDEGSERRGGGGWQREKPCREKRQQRCIG